MTASAQSEETASMQLARKRIAPHWAWLVMLLACVLGGLVFGGWRFLAHQQAMAVARPQVTVASIHLTRLLETYLRDPTKGVFDEAALAITEVQKASIILRSTGDPGNAAVQDAVDFLNVAEETLQLLQGRAAARMQLRSSAHKADRAESLLKDSGTALAGLTMLGEALVDAEKNGKAMLRVSQATVLGLDKLRTKNKLMAERFGVSAAIEEDVLDTVILGEATFATEFAKSISK